MFRMITLTALTLALSGAGAAFAQPSGYGTEGPGGERLNTRARSTWERHWNADNEPRNRAMDSAEWVRRHGQGFPTPF